MSALPTMIRKGKPLSIKAFKPTAAISKPKPHVLNSDQEQAVNQICASLGQFQSFTLDGVTGSGKTEVYLQAIAKVVEAGKQVLVLIPEISLTPQTIARFRARFNVPLVALHSSLTDQARLQAWAHARDGSCQIVIGTRSAIFTPFAKLGLIIVDEEHDHSFKQQERFRYHARDLAIMRARANRIPIVLGSATPSLETVLNTARARYTCLPLPSRAGGAMQPNYRIINLLDHPETDGLSAPTIQAIKAHLEAQNQVMVFINRRGFAPVIYCAACKAMARCTLCDIPMVFHKKEKNLQCHHCDAHRLLPKTCDRCGQACLMPIGLGTERLEAKLKKLFPQTPLIRVDRDSTKRKGQLEALLESIHKEPSAILLGTQMLAKGHHFPNVTLVCIIDTDNGLFSSDYRAQETMGQLLLQVAGRAGRELKRGEVLIQTRHPEHPLLEILTKQGYTDYAAALLKERAQAALPPYTYFAVLRVQSRELEAAQTFLDSVKKAALNRGEQISLLGPVAAMIKKRKGLHQQHLLFKAANRSHLQQFLKPMMDEIDLLAKGLNIKWILDVDPLQI